MYTQEYITWFDNIYFVLRKPLFSIFLDEQNLRCLFIIAKKMHVTTGTRILNWTREHITTGTLSKTPGRWWNISAANPVTLFVSWNVTIKKFHLALCCIDKWHTLFCVFLGILEDFPLITTPWLDHIILIHCLLENAFWKNLPLKFLVLHFSLALYEERFWTYRLWFCDQLQNKMESSELIDQVCNIYNYIKEFYQCELACIKSPMFTINDAY